MRKISEKTKKYLTTVKILCKKSKMKPLYEYPIGVTVNSFSSFNTYGNVKLENIKFRFLLNTKKLPIPKTLVDFMFALDDFVYMNCWYKRKEYEKYICEENCMAPMLPEDYMDFIIRTQKEKELFLKDWYGNKDCKIESNFVFQIRDSWEINCGYDYELKSQLHIAIRRRCIAGWIK